MKRIWALLLGVVLSVSLTACAENNLDQMYIEEAQLTEEEKNIEIKGSYIDLILGKEAEILNIMKPYGVYVLKKNK